MSRENVEIVRRGVEAVFRRPRPDFETVNALFHPEHEYVSITSAVEGRSWRGASGFRDFLKSFGESMEWTAEVEDTTELDQHRVLLVAVVSARGKSSDVGLSVRRGYLVTVREGKVMRTESYPSPEEALKAAGE